MVAVMGQSEDEYVLLFDILENLRQVKISGSQHLSQIGREL